MKIHIDKTETIWVDTTTKDSLFALAFAGYITYYRVLTKDNIFSGKLSHCEDLTIKEKKELIIQNLKELIK